MLPTEAPERTAYVLARPRSTMPVTGAADAGDGAGRGRGDAHRAGERNGDEGGAEAACLPRGKLCRLWWNTCHAALPNLRGRRANDAEIHDSGGSTAPQAPIRSPLRCRGIGRPPARLERNGQEVAAPTGTSCPMIRRWRMEIKTAAATVSTAAPITGQAIPVRLKPCGRRDGHERTCRGRARRSSCRALAPARRA